MSHHNSAAPAVASQPSDPAAAPHTPATAASDAAVPAGHAGDANGRRPSNAVAIAHEEKGLSTLEREQQALIKLRAKLAEEMPGHEVTDAKLLRFIRARKFDIDAAFHQYVKQVHWRKKFKVDDWESWDVAGYRKMVPEMFYGFDKQGLPSYIVKAGHVNAEHVRRMTVQDFVQVHVWGMEYSFRRCDESSKRLNKVVDRFCNIVDLDGLSLKHRKCLPFLKAVAKIDEQFYPESMGHTFIVNPPWVFSMFWSIVKPWLDPVTATKITVLGANYKQELLKYIDADQLPVEYGGTHPDSVKVYPAAETEEILRQAEEKMHLTEVTIKAGGKYEVNHDVGKFGGSCRYFFRTKGYDIKFTVTFTPADNPRDVQVIFKPTKVDSHKTPEKDMFDVYKAGRITLSWDNSYSIWKDKVLALSSAVTDHDEEMMPDEDNMPLSTAEVHHRRSSLGSAVPPPALPGLQAPHQIHAPAAGAAAAQPPS